MPKLSADHAKLLLLTQRKRSERRKKLELIKVVYFENCILRKSQKGRCSERASEHCKNYKGCLDITDNLNWPGFRLITQEEAKQNGLHSKTFYRTDSGAIQEAKEACPLGSEGTLIR